FLLIVLWGSVVLAQSTVSGTVRNTSGEPVPRINVILAGTYDGSSTDEGGFFSFETIETGEFGLELEGSGFVSQIITIFLPLEQPLEITMEEVTELEAVVFGAGMMKAVGNTNETVMSALDIVTTAGSDGDIIAAMQTLPGTNNVSEDGRLFIRGGEGE